MSKLNFIMSYLKEYIISYRKEYDRFTSQPPNGAGYPKLCVSPFLDTKELHCYVANDGVIVCDMSKEPSYSWEIAGGPALMADYTDTKTPIEIIEFLKKEGIYGQNTGIYRVTSKNGFSHEIWNGIIPEPIKIMQLNVEETILLGYQYDISLYELIQRLTYGVLCYVLDIHLQDCNAEFWNPNIITDLGFFPADRNSKRYFHYMEVYTHVEDAAWDRRSIWIRCNSDVRRDFKRYFIQFDKKGGYIDIVQKPEAIIEMFQDRLSILEKTINDFEKLLRDKVKDNESVFQDFLEKHPILLDVYGEPIAKPKFYYPDIESSPLGKKYIEPDFVIKYPGNKYKLVELEKPSKKMATYQGQQRSEVTQSAFQIAEWRHYIFNHYDQIKDRFPGISVPTNCSSMIVLSTYSSDNFGKYKSEDQFMELVNLQNTCEVLVYDDLLRKAKQAYDRLCNLISS